MSMFRLSVLVVALSVAGLSGCCGGGSKQETKNITTTQTLGDQLMDLQKARDSGAITEDQYNELKKKIIEQQTGD